MNTEQETKDRRKSGYGLMVFFLTLSGLFLLNNPVATQELIDRCPAVGIQPMPAQFEPAGIILTSFDRENLWVYDIDAQTRYPLPETRPCSTNCRISPDHQWLMYYDHANASYTKMRLDGTQRTQIAHNAFDVEWWTNEALLVWSIDGKVYLRYESADEQREYLPAHGLVSVQPGGRRAIRLQPEENGFRRLLINLRRADNNSLVQPPVDLGLDMTYFNQSSWSPDGKWLAYIREGAFDPSAGVSGTEIFALQIGQNKPRQKTDLTARYGATRINGSAIGSLSWSPDSAKLAFWVIKLLGPNIEANTGEAIIHILDIHTGKTVRYCGFATIEHTPVPPRLVWSPDSTHLAFGGNIIGDNRGYLLLALNVENGIFTEISEGVYPAYGSPDVIAWGHKPE